VSTPHRCYDCGGLLRPAAFDQAMCSCPTRRGRVVNRFEEADPHREARENEARTAAAGAAVGAKWEWEARGRNLAG
jgi:hypothetical protein